MTLKRFRCSRSTACAGPLLFRCLKRRPNRGRRFARSAKPCGLLGVEDRAIIAVGKLADLAELRRRAQRRTQALNESGRPTVSTANPVEPPRPSTLIGKKRASGFRSDHRRSSHSSNGSQAA